MAFFRETDEKIETIKGGCPICKADVKGNDIYLYFCQNCNVLFKKNELRISPETVQDAMKKSITQKFDKDREKLKLHQEPLKEKQITETKKIILEDRRKKIYHFASKKSNVVHASNCPYAKNIKLSNRIRFKTLEDAKNYKRCKCITEIK